MNRRRQFLKIGIGFPIVLSFILNPVFSIVRWVLAKAPNGTSTEGQDQKNSSQNNPSQVKTDDLEITDLKNFQTMGTTDHEVDLGTWRLEVYGQTDKPLTFTYSEILALPSIEKKVSLVCPGFFVNTGLWKGISMKELFGNNDIETGATHAVISGPEGPYPKTELFPIEDILSDKVFLAYEVNGKTLPKKHGFPLRIVAEGYYGDDWVKYVYKIKIEKR